MLISFGRIFIKENVFEWVRMHLRCSLAWIAWVLRNPSTFEQRVPELINFVKKILSLPTIQWEIKKLHTGFGNPSIEISNGATASVTPAPAGPLK